MSLSCTKLTKTHSFTSLKQQPSIYNMVKNTIQTTYLTFIVKKSFTFPIF